MNFKALVEAISKNNQEPKWLLDMRLAALNEFEKDSAPGAKEEEWRKLDLSQILFTDLNLGTGASQAKYDVPKGVYAASLSQAAKEIPEIARPYFEKNQRHNKKKYDALANALWNGGAFLHVPKNTQLETPLSINLTPEPRDGSSGKPGYFPKRILVIESNSAVTLSSQEGGSKEWGGWIGSSTDVYLKENSHFSFVRIQSAPRETVTLSSFWAQIEKNANLNFMVVSTGSILSKSNWTAELLGEGSNARIFGLVKGQDTQHFDHSVFVSHLVPHTSSNVLFKSAVDDKSRSMFTGLIHVTKQAQKTEAYQTNRNLILNKDARADTLPKLEIEADDVRCGHGAAVSNVDPDQIYYLMSRGLTREEASAVIIEGFYEDVFARWLENITNKSYQDDILEQLKSILFGSKNQSAVTA